MRHNCKWVAGRRDLEEHVRRNKQTDGPYIVTIFSESVFYCPNHTTYFALF
jgi:hypothetical protein